MPLDDAGEVTRDDVAATLLAVLDQPGTIGLSFDLLNGELPIADAIGSLIAESASPGPDFGAALAATALNWGG